MRILDRVETLGYQDVAPMELIFFFSFSAFSVPLCDKSSHFSSFNNLRRNRPTGDRLELTTASLLVPACGKCNEWPICEICG